MQIATAREMRDIGFSEVTNRESIEIIASLTILQRCCINIRPYKLAKISPKYRMTIGEREREREREGKMLKINNCYFITGITKTVSAVEKELFLLTSA